jgi:signal transduction histidine kinase
MNGILGMVDVLGGTDLDPEQREMLEVVHSSATALLGLLNDILDLSRIEAGRLEIGDAGYSLRAVCGDVIQLFAETARAKGIALQASFGDAPDALRGDSVRIKQILLNLVGNAIKFTSSGSVTLGVSLRGNSLRFEIADTGIGIDPEVAPLLFEPFTQADASTTRRFGGSGLGLAICRNLVLLLGGEIGLQSRPGAGSTFWFSVPYRAGV